AALEPILADVLASRSDWMIKQSTEHLLNVATASSADVLQTEKAVRERLFQWRIVTEIASQLVSLGELEAAKLDLAELFDGGPPLSLAHSNIILCDAAIVALRRATERIAPAPITVLILGETGVGKDVVASMLHELSPRSSKPFVRLNCASLP